MNKSDLNLRRLQMRTIRCIIAGCRDFNDLALMERTAIKIFNEKQYMPPDIEIVSGAANGADMTGERFAASYGIPVKRFPANWRRLGSYAGHMRNSDMAFYASQKGYKGILLAYWDNRSKGTRHMIQTALSRDIEVYVIDVRSEEIRALEKDSELFEKI